MTGRSVCPDCCNFTERVKDTGYCAELGFYVDASWRGLDGCVYLNYTTRKVTDGWMPFEDKLNEKLSMLYAHQREQYDRFKDEKNIGLGMDAGTGKTAVIALIAAYKYLKRDIDAVLYIAPNGVHAQNAEEILKWMPDGLRPEIQTLFGRGGKKQASPFADSEALQIVCVNVDTFSQPDKWKDIAEWAKGRKTFIVMDESHTIKSPDAARTQNIMYGFDNVTKRGKVILSIERTTVCRAIMTGTMIGNNLIDCWSQCEFLDPKLLNRNYYSFRERYAMLAKISTPAGVTQIPLTKELWEAVKRCPDYNFAWMKFGVTLDTYNTVALQDRYQGACKNEQELRDTLAGFCAFVNIEDTCDMPERTPITHKVIMSDEQARAYKQMERELIAEYGGAEMTAANGMVALLRLQQISSGFISQQAFVSEEGDVMPGEVVWLGKSVPKLEALYLGLETSRMPVIVVTRFSAEAARIYEDLKEKGKSVMLFTGWKETGTIAEYQEGKYDIIVANIAKINAGFNLQRGCVMWFYSCSQSLIMRTQVEGRIFRLGQKNTCVYNDMESVLPNGKSTVDKKVIMSLRQKKRLADYIKGKTLESFLKEEEL